MKKKLVVLTGAGISAESGLKTFRDSDGLWENFKVEEVASIDAWHANPKMVLQFYNERRKGVRAAQPNLAHQTLAALESDFEVTIVTQNIDDLHERAGSKNVLHLHGEIFKMKSEKNEGVILDIEDDIQLGDLCNNGYQLRPHIVWFGEAVPQIETAIPILEQADIFVLIGSSLAVYPAAGLVQFVQDHVPKFIIDPIIPGNLSRNFIKIEKSATAGMEDLKKALSSCI